MNVFLKDRWQSTEGKELSHEVWKRLIAKQRLPGLPIEEHDGRIDLRGISVPEVTTESFPDFRSWQIQSTKGRIEFRNVHFENIDFSHSQLTNLQFFNSVIDGCRFENADCAALGVRATDVRHTVFSGANLKDAVLGPWYQGRGNKYEFVDFSGADMRGVNSTTATYIDCDFANAKLNKIDFQSSSFIRCHFAGEVREVLFYGKTVNSKKETPNPMEDVDFSGAKLHWVEFRGLNLERVRFPEDEDHAIIRNYRCVLGRVLTALKADQSPYAGRLRAILELELKWLGPKQEIGILRRLDFRERWGRQGEEFALRLFAQAERECGRVQ